MYLQQNSKHKQEGKIWCTSYICIINILTLLHSNIIRVTLNLLSHNKSGPSVVLFPHTLKVLWCGKCFGVFLCSIHIWKGSPWADQFTERNVSCITSAAHPLVQQFSYKLFRFSSCRDGTTGVICIWRTPPVRVHCSVVGWKKKKIKLSACHSSSRADETGCV